MDTIEYYNKYASRIFEDTVDRDMEPQREEFLEELREIDGDTILDLGCGSGRDSLAFYEQGPTGCIGGDVQAGGDPHRPGSAVHGL